jgi:hypothetical protein
MDGFPLMFVHFQEAELAIASNKSIDLFSEKESAA